MAPFPPDPPSLFIYKSSKRPKWMKKKQNDKKKDPKDVKTDAKCDPQTHEESPKSLQRTPREPPTLPKRRKSKTCRDKVEPEAKQKQDMQRQSKVLKKKSLSSTQIKTSSASKRFPSSARCG